MTRVHHSELTNGAGLEAFSAYPRRIGELMTTDVVQLHPQTLFREAVDLLAKNHFRHLLVAEPGGQLVGVISDRDVLRAAESYESDTTLVADVMTPAPLTVTVASALSEAISLVLEHRVNCLPVVDGGGKICGIVTTTDLLAAFQALQVAVEKLPEPSAALHDKKSSA